jgi:hypothetical protein
VHECEFILLYLFTFAICDLRFVALLLFFQTRFWGQWHRLKLMSFALTGFNRYATPCVTKFCQLFFTRGFGTVISNEVWGQWHRLKLISFALTGFNRYATPCVTKFLSTVFHQRFWDNGIGYGRWAAIVMLFLVLLVHWFWTLCWEMLWSFGVLVFNLLSALSNYIAILAILPAVCVLGIGSTR